VIPFTIFGPLGLGFAVMGI